MGLGEIKNFLNADDTGTVTKIILLAIGWALVIWLWIPILLAVGTVMYLREKKALSDTDCS
jgi:hypothetical protein